MPYVPLVFTRTLYLVLLSPVLVIGLVLASQIHKGQCKTSQVSVTAERVFSISDFLPIIIKFFLSKCPVKTGNKKRLSCAIASEKLNNGPKFQKDRMCRFRFISNSFFQYINYTDQRYILRY